MKMNRNVNKYIKDCKHFFPFLKKCTVAILVCCLWRGILIYKSYHDSKNSKVKHIEYTIEEVN